MANTPYDLKADKLFPLHFRFVGGVLVVVGMAALLSSIILAVILVAVGGAMLTGYAGIEFYKQEKKYREYNSFLFLKNGARKNYDGVEKIFINSKNVSQRMYTAHTSHSSNIHHVEYNAYLKFGEQHKIHLKSMKNKEALIKALGPLAQYLDTQVVDLTE